MPLGRMVEPLMVLDAVLDDRTFTWLGTEFDKRSYFLRHLQGRIELREFPRLTFGSGTQRTHRHFPDKLPIGIQADRGRTARSREGLRRRYGSHGQTFRNLSSSDRTEPRRRL